MIVWLASFPRSGNTFLRIVLNRVYGAPTSVIYDADGVAGRLGRDFVGSENRPGDYDAMRRSEGAHFIKTHRQRDERVHPDDHAICLVRDGRDVLTSYAHLLSERSPETFQDRLRDLIEWPGGRGTGRWGANVLSWLTPRASNQFVVTFDDLIARPEAVVAKAIEAVAPHLDVRKSGVVPSFAELAERDAGFFRKGVSGEWREEMPPALHDLFWAQPDHRAAMELLGYGRDA